MEETTWTDCPPTVIITGGAGFIGHHLAASLSRDGAKITILDDLSRGKSYNLRGFERLHVVDLRERSVALSMIKGVDIVYHLAAPVGGVSAVFQDEAKYQGDMMVIDSNVIEACRANGIRKLVYVSSVCACAKDKQEAPLQVARPLRDDDVLPANPESGYGWGKIAGEMLCKSAAGPFLQIPVARLHNVYGEGAHYCTKDPSSIQVIPALVFKALKAQLNNTSISVGGNGDQFRDFIHIEDVVRGLRLLGITNTTDHFKAVQFGTGVGTRIREVAEMISRQVSPENPLPLEFDLTFPTGDQGRFADISTAGTMGWKPSVHLEAGIARQVRDIRLRMQHEDSHPRLAICVPITSRGVLNPKLCLEKFAENLPDSAVLYFAVDTDDAFYATKPVQFFQDVTGRACSRLFFSPSKPPKIYHMYNALVKCAFRDGADYFVLFGDDVTVSRPLKKDNCWLVCVQQKFANIDAIAQTPGLGCVALNDETSVGFPTFPVVRRRHIELFGEQFCPSVFLNQDADPWVFELYRPWNIATFAENVLLQNAIGGANHHPRYERQHIDWKNDILHDAQATLKRYLGDPTVISLDVVIPTYRLEVSTLRKILSIRVPPSLSVLFIIIIDNPTSPRAAAVKSLEAEYAPKVRVRCNPSNLGASGARNRGIEESAADWILFLDDDVEPTENILEAYAKAIREKGHDAIGFLGPTYFPEEKSLLQLGTRCSYCLYFWDVAARQEQASWGVTANLLMKRTRCRFNTSFVKTGGGEDIDFCLVNRTQSGKRILCVPDATAVHPWWNQGNFSMRRFFDWTQGDGLLLDMYPDLTYSAFPNFIENLFFIFVLCILSCTIGLQSLSTAILNWGIVCNRLPGGRVPSQTSSCVLG